MRLNQKLFKREYYMYIRIYTHMKKNQELFKNISDFKF